MNFSNILCSHSTFPPLHCNETLLPIYPPINPLKIPPFPYTKSLTPLIGSKRPNPHNVEPSSMNEMESGKRIKMDSFNMLFKADFTEKDPYMTRSEYSGDSDKQKSGRRSIICQQPNKTTIKENGITINISVNKKPVQKENKNFSLKSGEGEFKLPPELTQYFQTIKAGVDLQGATNIESVLGGFDTLYKSLEIECFNIWEKMQEVLLISQKLRSEPFKFLSIGTHSEDTRPGTPEISPKSLSGRKIDMENFSETSEKSQERKRKVVEESPLKDITKKLNCENQFENGAFRRISNNQKGSGSEQKTKKEKKGIVEEPTEVFNSYRKAKDHRRRKNRLQILKAERERYEDEISKPYLIPLDSQNGDLSQRIVYTRVGEAYQVVVPPFSLNDVSKRSIQLREKSSPEMSLVDENRGNLCCGKLEGNVSGI